MWKTIIEPLGDTAQEIDANTIDQLSTILFETLPEIIRNEYGTFTRENLILYLQEDNNELLDACDAVHAEHGHPINIRQMQLDKSRLDGSVIGHLPFMIPMFDGFGTKHAGVIETDKGALQTNGTVARRPYGGFEMAFGFIATTMTDDNGESFVFGTPVMATDRGITKAIYDVGYGDDVFTELQKAARLNNHDDK